MKKTHATKLGNANGYFLKKTLSPKRPGYCSAGRAKKPPKEGPKMLPSDHTRGMMEKALAWCSFSVTISATMVLMMPTLPLPAPWMKRTVIAIAKLVDIPQIKKQVMVLTAASCHWLAPHSIRTAEEQKEKEEHLQRPSIIVGFLPMRSEAIPQGTAVRLWAMLKTAPVRPAHRATLLLFTPKLKIISGR